VSEEGASRIDLTSVFTPFAAIVISLALIWSIGLKLLGTIIQLRKEVRKTKRELQKALDLLGGETPSGKAHLVPSQRPH